MSIPAELFLLRRLECVQWGQSDYSLKIHIFTLLNLYYYSVYAITETEIQMTVVDRIAGKKVEGRRVGLFGKPNIAKMVEKENHLGLLGALRNKQADIRIQAIHGLKTAGFPSNAYFIEILNLAERDSNEQVKDAAFAVVQSESFRLLNLLEQGSDGDKYHTLCVLGKINDSAFIDPILHATEHENEVVRQRAVSALSFYCTDKVVERLISMVESDPHPVVQLTAASTLKGISEELSNEHLKNAIELALKDLKSQ